MNGEAATRLDPLDDDTRFDRLVDGELSAEEYRSLLVALDEEPGGWRRCALAFLEAQAMTWEARSVRRAYDPPAIVSPPAEASHNAGLMRPRLGLSRMLLAVAASFLVAFGLGVAVSRMSLSRESRVLLTGADARPAPAIPSRHNELAAAPATAVPGAASGNRHQTYRPIGNVRLVVNGPEGNETEAGRLPVYETTQGLEHFLLQDEQYGSALSSQLIEALEQRGHEVQRQQQYLPFELEDGRQMIVPVEGYQITPVNRRVY